MNFGGPTFVVTIVAICMAGWVIMTFIRARHGYPLTDDNGNTILPVKRDDEQTRALAAENERLKDTVAKLEDRLKVLERIATDPSERVAREIEQLREKG